jgi:hypothetical protein
MTRSRRPRLDIPSPASPFRPQHTPRRHIRTLCRWFENALPGGSAGISALLARLDGPLSERRHLAAVALVIAHLRGDIRPARWQRMTGVAGVDPHEIDRDMDRVWNALVDAKLVQRTLLYMPGTRTTGPRPRAFGAFPVALAARWVRTDRWRLMEQDEDLLLFDAMFMEPLLRGAAAPDAARRDFARAIVAHAVRDAACQSVVASIGERSGAGVEADDTLASLARNHARWAHVARETGAIEVAEYLERLASYGSPRTFDAEQAMQVFIDLARCEPTSRARVRMCVTERGWIGSVPHSGFSRTPRVHIDRETGVIALVPRSASRVVEPSDESEKPI